MAKQDSKNLRYFNNRNGPVISVVSRNIIEDKGLYFKVIDGIGKFFIVNYWRRTQRKERMYLLKHCRQMKRMHNFLNHTEV